jgi:hypothetical protein
MALTTATVAAVVDSALKSGNRLDFISPLFSTAAAAQAARDALTTIVPSLNAMQMNGVVRCVSGSSKWTPNADAQNLALLRSVLASLAASAPGDGAMGIAGGGNLIAALVAAIP